MGTVSIILRRPPYGSVDASEAIRHALGGVTTGEMAVRLILLDAGVNAARKGQDTSSTEYLSIEAGVRDCIDMGVEVYVDEGSLKEQEVEVDDIIEGVVIENSSRIAGLVKESGTTMIF